MKKIAVIADDLTGATDTGIQFAAAGLETLVVLDEALACDNDFDAIVLDTDSRGIPRVEAAERARVAAERALSCGAAMFYKKIDSTLRGHFGAELEAVRAAGGFDCAVVAPAFPRQGRTTRGGVQYLYGTPVSETDAGRDPVCPVSESRVAKLLESQGASPAVSVGTGLLREGRESAEAFIRDACRKGIRYFIFDAETGEDLLLVAGLCRIEGVKILPCGSAGLAEHLFPAAAFPPRKPEDSPRAAGPVLIVAGSVSEVTRAQVEEVLARPDVAGVRFDPESDTEDSVFRKLNEALLRGVDTCFYTVHSAGANAGAAARKVSALMAAAAARAVRGTAVDSLVLTGGETARGVCAALGASGIRLLREIEPGIPLGVLSAERDYRVVTKAGAFGGRDSLVRALKILKFGPVDDRPVIALTMGDASGIGPEIIMKVMTDREVVDRARILVIGDRVILERAAAVVGLPDLRLNIVADPGEALFEYGTVDCVDLGLLPADLPFGKVLPEAGNAAYHYLVKAVEFAKAGTIHAICTAPLNKEALHKGGHKYPGHTELLASLTGAEEVAMMLSSPRLKVIHVTTHVGLVDAVRMIAPERVYRVICMASETLKKAGIVQPRIAVCGINPHAGEHGLFGYQEEEEKIVPAVRRARAEGIAVTGPLPADTVFFRAVRGDFDIVVAMYHDQGHVPVKVLGFEAGVNISVGLPVIRTSVDHGTAFDIAGKGIADDRSLKEALLQAVELAPKG